MVSGTQRFHSKLRAKVCRFMVTQGNSLIDRYLKTKIYQKNSPVSYLKESCMDRDHIWGTDVEILACLQCSIQ